jgi:type III restriction enzyme
VKAVYDLSATPFYLGQGYKEGYIFPWTVSDFSLMDAIESGIVKVPGIPVDDDTVGDTVTYRNLWELVGKDLPKRSRAQTDVTTDWVMPAELEGALQSLYRSYQKRLSTTGRRSSPHSSRRR